MVLGGCARPCSHETVAAVVSAAAALARERSARLRRMRRKSIIGVKRLPGQLRSAAGPRMGREGLLTRRMSVEPLLGNRERPRRVIRFRGVLSTDARSVKEPG